MSRLCLAMAQLGELVRAKALLRSAACAFGPKEALFALVPRSAPEVVVLARPVEEKQAAVLAFLADGESWSSSALALALGSRFRDVIVTPRSTSK